jgi:hypothetical protein
MLFSLEIFVRRFNLYRFPKKQLIFNESNQLEERPAEKIKRIKNPTFD